MISMYIGSGDVSALLSGKNTKSFQKLLQRFVSNEIPYYNALASPIDALRTGAILEEIYGEQMAEGYYSQVKVQYKEMDVFKASLDFARYDKNTVTHFEELKTISFEDFLVVEKYKGNEDSGIPFVKKTFSKYWNQVQEQLMCTDLKSATLVFLVVYTYNDEENYSRIIKSNEFIKFNIPRDEEAISLIKERGKIFQQIKDYFPKQDEQ